jgi:hypothetical protein
VQNNPQNRQKEQNCPKHFGKRRSNWATAVLLEVTVKRTMRRPDHSGPIAKNAGALVVDHLRCGFKDDLMPRQFHSTAPIDVAEKHGKRIVPEANDLQQLAAKHQTGALRLINLSAHRMVEVTHLPIIEDLAPSKKITQAEYLKENVAAPGEPAARMLDRPVLIQQLRRHNRGASLIV